MNKQQRKIMKKRKGNKKNKKVDNIFRKLEERKILDMRKYHQEVKMTKKKTPKRNKKMPRAMLPNAQHGAFGNDGEF